jgi:serine/threonine protein phosphatase PrpC
LELHLYLDQDTAAAETIQMPSGTAAVVSRRCPNATGANEDAALVWSGAGGQSVLAVADGMGGGRVGEEAARMALDHLVRALMDHSEAPLRSRVIDGIEEANRAVLALGVGAATTLAAVAIDDRRARPYHVGDTTILVCGQRGRLKWQTLSHSPVGFAVEAGVLNEDDALHHEDRHVVSNVVGSPGMRIEVGPQLLLSTYDTVLLASDGLFDNLRLDEVVQTVRKGPLAASVWSLSRAALQRMIEPQAQQPSKPDDCTVVAFRPAAASAAVNRSDSSTDGHGRSRTP